MYTANLPWNFGLLDWLPASGSESIKNSQNDMSVRPIGVRIFLEDPRARTPHIWALMPERTEYHLEIEEKTVDLWIFAALESKFVGGLQLGTYAESAKDGLLRCAPVALSNMSTWSVQLQRPVAIREIRIEDKTNSAIWGIRPQAQTPLQPADLNVSLATGNAIGSLLALFREGMASVQPAYRFLCYFKILDAWKNHHGPFAQTDEQLKAKGKRRDTSTLLLRDDMFAGKWPTDNYKHNVGRKFTSYIDEMDDARNFLAHPFRRSNEFVSFDDPRTLAHFADLANVAERMAIEVLVEEVKLISSCDETGVTGRVAQSITHRSWAPEFSDPPA